MARSYGKSELQLLKSHARQLPPVDDVASRFSGRVGEPDSCNKDIPDASLIHAMKKKREMLREMGGSSAASFISLDVNDDDDDDEGANGGSTLVREEDELGDGEEAFEDHAGNRIVFGGDAVKKFRDQRRQLIREIIDDGFAHKTKNFFSFFLYLTLVHVERPWRTMKIVRGGKTSKFGVARACFRLAAMAWLLRLRKSLAASITLPRVRQCKLIRHV